MVCLLCKQPGRLLHAQVPDYLLSGREAWDIHYCANDKLAWIDDSKSVTNLAAYYDSYHAHQAHDSVSTVSFSALKARYFFNYPAWPEPKASVKILDFGCGGAQLLKQLQAVGFDVYGVEFDEELVRSLASTLGVDKIYSVDKLGLLPENSFDAIVLNHVVEHLTDPLSILMSLQRLLRPGGVIMLATPNLEAWGRMLFAGRWRGWELPRHRYLFSDSALVKLLSMAGYKTDKVMFSSRLARGMFVSGFMPAWERLTVKPRWRYLLHLGGYIFAILARLLAYVGLAGKQEELIVFAHK